jgi:alkaline phosphatase D
MTDVFEVLERGVAEPMERRRFLQFTGALAGAAAFCQLRGDLAQATTPLRGYPFTLGVASGDPELRGAVLWTRLAPDIYSPDGGMPARRLPVQWRLAKDPGMRRVVRRGVTLAVPELAHSVHVEVSGLEPGREYYFQFKYRDEVSPVGRTITIPSHWHRVDSLQFAFASCQAWDHGYYSAYRNMAEEDLAFVVHLGDYLYEYGIDEHGGVRNVPVPEQFRPECQTLERYRIQYSLYKSDPDLRKAHELFPWLITWDDHEVQNDYAGLTPEGGEPNPAFTARRAAAYQAFYEHIPLRAEAMPRGGQMRLYRRMTWGDLAEFSLLDGRQYRTDQPCGDGEFPRCPESLDPRVTMLGERQERWLNRNLERSRARWNVIAQQVLMAQLVHDPGTHPDPPIYWHDAWDGYPAARQRIIDHLIEARVRNPVLITGDWHSTFVNDIKQDFSNPASATVATEFVGTSISTNDDLEVYGPYYGRFIPANPHIKFFDGDRRGYVRCLLDREQWRTDLRMVTSVSDAGAPVYTFASFEVEDGQPGAHGPLSPPAPPPP